MLFVVRVIRTVAPSPSSRRASARDTRQVKVASGKPPLVAVPVVLHAFHSPTQTSRPISRGCRLLPSWCPGSIAIVRPASGSGAAWRGAGRSGRSEGRRSKQSSTASDSRTDLTPAACRDPATVDGLDRSAPMLAGMSAARRPHRGRPRGHRPQGLRLRRRLAGLVPERADARRPALEALAEYAGRYAVVARLARVRFSAAAGDALDRRRAAAGRRHHRLRRAPRSSPRHRPPGPHRRRGGPAGPAARARAGRSWTGSPSRRPSELRKGPRGGGRDRDKVVDHVIEAERSYARTIGVRHPPFHGDAGALEALPRRDRAGSARGAQRRADAEVDGTVLSAAERPGTSSTTSGRSRTSPGRTGSRHDREHHCPTRPGGGRRPEPRGHPRRGIDRPGRRDVCRLPGRERDRPGGRASRPGAHDAAHRGPVDHRRPGAVLTPLPGRLQILGRAPVRLHRPHPQRRGHHADPVAGAQGRVSAPAARARRHRTGEELRVSSTGSRIALHEESRRAGRSGPGCSSASRATAGRSARGCSAAMSRCSTSSAGAARRVRPGDRCSVLARARSTVTARRGFDLLVRRPAPQRAVVRVEDLVNGWDGLCLVYAPLSRPSRISSGAAARTGRWAFSPEGIQYAVRRKDLLGTYVIDMTAMFLAYPIVLFPAFAHAVFDQPKTLGLLYTAESVGSLRDADQRLDQPLPPPRPAVVVASMCWGGAIALAGPASAWLALVFRLRRRRGHDQRHLRSTIWHQTIPDEKRGRLAGIEMLSYSVGPLGGQARAGSWPTRPPCGPRSSAAASCACRGRGHGGLAQGLLALRRADRRARGPRAHPARPTAARRADDQSGVLRVQGRERRQWWRKPPRKRRKTPPSWGSGAAGGGAVAFRVAIGLS